MSALTIPDSPAAPRLQRLWVLASVTLGFGALAFCLIFRTEFARAVEVWDESTAYNHCFLVLPIVAYLLWERRRPLLARAPAAMAWPLAAMAPVAVVWLVAREANLMEGRQLAAMTLFELFALAVLGSRAWRVVAFALLYLYFLVPAGAFITPILQDFAAHFAVSGIKLVGIPIYSDGLNIEVPGAKFVVAEACAGLRFLIASVAFGALYSYLMYRSWQRRAVFVAVSFVVPIIANGFRVMGIVILGYWLDSAQAATADHLIYGWVFFSAVTVLLIALGQPFRQAPHKFSVQSAEADLAAAAPGRGVAVAAVSLLFVALLASPVVVDGAVGRVAGALVSEIKGALRH